MTATEDFHVRFWGVRGSIACSAPNVCKYGGNTSSLEIRCGDHILMFDAGSGMRYLGNDLMRRGGPVDIDLFLTHTHFDHVCGIPFFVPFFVPGNSFRFWSGHLLPRLTLKRVLKELMMAPLFPVPIEILQADIAFRDFHAGETVEPKPGITVRTARLNHPDGATGYRVEFQGKSICYLTDTEHVLGHPDPRILALIEGADIVIYDSMYTDETFKPKIGWGHSTWQEGVRLADAAGVKTFVAFHHDPDHDDTFMDGIAEALEARRPGSIVAREGLVLRP
ncbi:MBL fold metallo-hydrolase [Oceanibacterium hippocampi]|uniref:Ribonuclease Z n=1 Tax=Oceanibacterium hippocampi TaxID=745714 RepID=A0A1Y5RQA0_9PROT|nr:MBL fold metallo-hydrolase [Oceanibacterium hippocampi]SLN20129.1 ribonuclease Z [Oceanibacterium hippocampi]